MYKVPCNCKPTNAIIQNQKEIEVMCQIVIKNIALSIISATESKYLPVYEGFFLTRASSPSAASKIDLKIKKNAANQK